MKAYRELERRFARDAVLGDVTGLLQWDCETMMPEGAAEGRAEQLATVKRIAHELLVCDATQDLLAVAEAEAGALDEAQQANLREMRRSYAHASAVPSDVVEASSRAVSKAENAWRAARRESDFKLLLPHLEEVLRIRREVGAAKGAALGLSPYDALLDSHDPDLRQAKVDPLFDDLRAALPGLVEEACARQQALGPIERPAGPFPTAVQRRLGEMLAQAVGFDLDRGRLDVSLHPFSGGATGDVRITTRYDEDDFAGALMGVLHESGHALYEQGLPRSWAHQPAGAARGMSLHESQSLIIEMQAGRSRAFTRFLAPLLRQAFAGEGPAWSANNLHRIAIEVRPGLIRVDADEVTYPAHIVLRYDLEKAMIAGDLAVADLPGAFNARMKELLGLEVPDDRRGCLQDIHWPAGAFGYFPTYTLGAMTAAQLFEAALCAEPAIPEALAGGDFTPLREWLKANVHGKGSLLEADDLLTAATGRPLEADVFRRHLRARYVEGAGI